MVNDFCEMFKNTLLGKFDRRKSSAMTKDLLGGAHIREVFNNLL